MFSRTYMQSNFLDDRARKFKKLMDLYSAIPLRYRRDIGRCLNGKWQCKPDTQATRACDIAEYKFTRGKKETMGKEKERKGRTVYSMLHC